MLDRWTLNFETFLVLLFTTIIVATIVTNPQGVIGFFQGLAGFTAKTVDAFTGGRGVIARTSTVSPMARF